MSAHTLPNFVRAAPSLGVDPGRALSPAIDSDDGYLDVRGVGAIGYYKDLSGEGPAVVLIHSVNAAASSYEMRPLFEAYRGRRRVFALDLPGFGRSQRGDRAYSPALYADAIERFIVDVVSPQGVAVDAVASSLSSEFLALVAARAPELFRSLTLLSPTGLGASPGEPGLASRLARRLLSLDPASAALFRLLRTPTAVRYFLKKSFVGPLDEGLVSYAVQSAAMPGAGYAPMRFISGALSSPDALRSLYEPLAVPTRVIFDQDPYTGFERLDALVRSNPRVTSHRVAPTRGMPHFERAAAVIDVMEQPVVRERATT